MSNITQKPTIAAHGSSITLPNKPKRPTNVYRLYSQKYKGAPKDIKSKMWKDFKAAALNGDIEAANEMEDFETTVSKDKQDIRLKHNTLKQLTILKTVTPMSFVLEEKTMMALSAILD
jgi:hypothetical protein